MNGLRYILVLTVLFPLSLLSQNDSTEWRQTLPSHELIKGVGLDFGVDISGQTAVRFGYAITEERAGGICAFGYFFRGTAVGITINPALESYGLYVNRWVSVGTVFTMGVKGAYEVGPRSSWFSAQPQIGIGNGRFRLLYSYTVPMFLERKTLVPRHAFTLAFTPFSMPFGERR